MCKRGYFVSNTEQKVKRVFVRFEKIVLKVSFFNDVMIKNNRELLSNILVMIVMPVGILSFLFAGVAHHEQTM